MDIKISYYVNKLAQTNGDHEVHDEFCIYLPSVLNRRYLGEFYSCMDAVLEAKTTYTTADGCKFCSPTCHKR